MSLSFKFQTFLLTSVLIPLFVLLNRGMLFHLKVLLTKWFQLVLFISWFGFVVQLCKLRIPWRICHLWGGGVRGVSIIPRSAIFRDRKIDLSMASIVYLILAYAAVTLFDRASVDKFLKWVVLCEYSFNVLKKICSTLVPFFSVWGDCTISKISLRQFFFVGPGSYVLVGRQKVGVNVVS